MSELKIPTELLYTKDHEWVRKESDGVVYIGITDYAQSSLGDIVYVDLEYQEGDKVEKEKVFGSIEAVKTVSELFMPITGEIIEINEDLNDIPDMINNSPYDNGWILKIKISDEKEFDELLDSDSYKDITE